MEILQALRFYRCDSLQLSGLTLVDSPRTHISMQYCNYANVSYLQIRAPEDSPNTDGIDISMSSNVNIHDCNIGTGKFVSLTWFSVYIIINQSGNSILK